jgi:hypothetical protein
MQWYGKHASTIERETVFSKVERVGYTDSMVIACLLLFLKK